MQIIIISIIALIASCLTLFSGFGLGTILTPAFVIFFPVETAIALTAVVHFLNNILKLLLLWKYARWDVALRFGFAAFFAAFLGAKVLFLLEKLPPLYTYHFFRKEATITSVKLIIAILMILFVILELVPIFQKISFPPKFLPLGGIFSGFFGGLSGHQGALRSMFLLKCGLTKENFIATGVVIACLIDFSRIAVYRGYLLKTQYQDYWPLMVSATLSAFIGVFIGNRLIKKVTMKTIQIFVSFMLCVIALLLGAGVI